MRTLRRVGLLVILLSMLGCASREERAAKAIERGNAAMARKDYDTVIAEFTEAIRLGHESDGAYHNRGKAYAEKGDYAKAVADYNEWIRLAPDDRNGYTTLAWLLATCPQAEARDGPRSVELAQQACKLSGWRDASDLEKLAAGYAESGWFDEAIKWQRNAIGLGTGLKSTAEAHKRLELYRSGEPYRVK